MHIRKYCILMAAVFTGVLIIVESLLWLRGVFNQRSVGGKQTILCLCNSHQSHKHKHKINNWAKSRLRSRRVFFFSAWKLAASLLWFRRAVVLGSALRMTCFLVHSNLTAGIFPVYQQIQNGSLQVWVVLHYCFLVLILRSCPDRITIPNTQNTEMSLKAGFVSKASFYLSEQYTGLCTCFQREDTDSVFSLLPLGKYIFWVLCKGEPCSGDKGPPCKILSGG